VRHRRAAIVAQRHYLEIIYERRACLRVVEQAHCRTLLAIERSVQHVARLAVGIQTPQDAARLSDRLLS